MTTPGRVLSEDGGKVHHPDVGGLEMLLQDLPSKSVGVKNTTASVVAGSSKLTNSVESLDATISTLNQHHNATQTSMFLIVFLHLLFLHQWNSRKRRKDVLVSYRAIVQKRQYHKLWLAMLSHPPSHNQRSQNNTPQSPIGTSSSAEDAGTDREPHQPLELRGQITTKTRQIATWAYQSGFALMLYNSHIIWSCRSLEALYVLRQGIEDESANSQLRPHQYARVLFALTGMALLLELRFSFTLLRISRKLDGSSAPVTTVPSRERNNNHNRMQHKILHRPIGTMTALSCALLVVFQYHFEYVPLQVLPFIDNQWLLLGFSIPVTLTSLLCWGILGYLSYPSHPITPVLCGLTSGLLWNIGFSFLQEKYWGNSLFCVFCLMCCLSIRAGSNLTREANETPRNSLPHLTTPTWIPCIDFVSWNRRGESIRISGNFPDETVHSSDDGESSGYDSSDDSSFNSHDDAMHGEDHREDMVEDRNDVEMAPLLDIDQSQTVRARRGRLASAG